MVCPRCIESVQRILTSLEVPFSSVRLGEVALISPIEPEKKHQLSQNLQTAGFSLLSAREEILTEGIKTVLIELCDSGPSNRKQKLSVLLQDQFHMSYSRLSALFSETAGLTIESYFIRLRIEKAREYLSYPDLTIKEIADKLGFSSPAHLASAFKKTTGMTMTAYRNSTDANRLPLDSIGPRITDLRKTP